MPNHHKNKGLYSAALTAERLFIMDGVISLPVAIAGYFLIPDVPETSRASYLTTEVSKVNLISIRLVF